MIDRRFRERYWREELPRPNDDRDEYRRDRARIIHSAAFRRLQAKTQVMGVGEGDFHRTRLTHSIETGQIGEGLLGYLKKRYAKDPKLSNWLPGNDLVLATCYAHDLGHPPFGHQGERALHQAMTDNGGFEANGQTLRILTRLEKHDIVGEGINPTRRLILGVLKYPIAYSNFDLEAHQSKPPKCYLDTETSIVDWALSKPFTPAERELFTSEILDGKAKHRSLDASLMELADDIAYGVHDLEDIVARHLVTEEEVVSNLQDKFFSRFSSVGPTDNAVSLEDFKEGLAKHISGRRKQLIGTLVNLFITSAEIVEKPEFQHPLLRYRVSLPPPLCEFLKVLKDMTYSLVISHAEMQQLERRGRRVVEDIFAELVNDPESLIPDDAWSTSRVCDSTSRRVCDYVAGMTDPYAERIYRRLFIPGYGSSRDEL